ncbi:rab11 family-interacting protein 1 [Neolamprologus brichardi]|uniref:rab11 family-interacting protein 1 n=1 Tax=Neolamprologus brichardi TaxID=32507 RepID=UPI001643F460|nr:rab11 family-interacting protein 1 [Neolamprologus brichardi]
MMSLIDLDDDQRWVPTHVNVTVLRAKGLRTKGKHGSRYLYTIIQVGKEKYTTGLVEKAEVPVWNEECCFELLPGILEDGGRSAYPPGSGDLVLTVMHRVLIGLDVFLGQTIIPLDKIFHDGVCPRDEWFKLNSKAGRKEKERGQLQITVQFTRNNMTASMFDLTMKDKPRSAFGKLKDRVTGRKRGDVESSSAIVPGRYAALSGSLGQPFGEQSVGVVESRDVEVAEEKRSKMKDFFKGKLRKSSDTRSCSSLASESSLSSMASDNLGPPPSLDLLSDPPSSPILLTSQHTTKVLTHKRAFSDEASKITTAFPRANPAVESLKGQTMTQSQSSLCINGSHVYDSEPSTPKSSGALSSKLVLLEKCSPLSRSLQNLTKRSEDKASFAEGRRWSFDKLKKEEKEEEKDAQASSTSIQEAQIGGCPVQAAVPTVSSAAESADKGKKPRKTFFSGGRSDSLPSKSELSHAGSEGRLRGWFGSSESQNKPRLEVSPKVERSSDVPPPLPPRSPVPPQCSSPSASLSGHVSPDDCSHINVFTPSSSPSSTPISPSNPFLLRMQRNPFFEELIAGELQKSPPFEPCSSAGSSPFHYTTLPAQPHTPTVPREVSATNIASIKRERPRAVARQISLPALSPKVASPTSPNHSAPCSRSESTGEWDDSFDAFASSRLNSPNVCPPQKKLTTCPSSRKRSYPLATNSNYAQELRTCNEEPPPLPPRRLLRTSVNEIYSDGWLHRGQELAVHKEAYLLSQTGVASLQRGREGECKRNNISPDPHTSSETSETSESLGLSQSHTNVTSPGLTPEDKLKKFKYEPLEDDADCWGGMLFEQDLYGRVCRRNYGQCKVNSHRLSLNAEETAGIKITSKSSGPKMLLESEISVADLLKMSPTSLSHVDAKALGISPTPGDILETNLVESPCTNNNISFSLTLGDLNMNVNNTDFGFIDSDGSSHSEVGDKSGTLQQPPESSQVAVHHSETKPEEIFTLKDTYIPEMNSSFEISSNKLCKVAPVSQDNCRDYRNELNNVAPLGLAPNSRNPCEAKIGQSLHEPPFSPSILSALSLSADAPVCCPSVHPSSTGPSAGASTTLAVAPYTSSYSTTFTTDQPLVAARHSLLPEETQTASSLPRQESRPHPVKPITSSQSEKKEGRSVLEKLKQEVMVDRSAQYQHLTNMELITLLLQQEMDMQKQQGASEQQEAQLEKCEAELKKVKSQVRDLEDYIDNLLLRIMEQTPTLLQVRARHK